MESKILTIDYKSQIKTSGFVGIIPIENELTEGMDEFLTKRHKAYGEKTYLSVDRGSFVACGCIHISVPGYDVGILCLEPIDDEVYKISKISINSDLVANDKIVSGNIYTNGVQEYVNTWVGKSVIFK